MTYVHTRLYQSFVRVTVRMLCCLFYVSLTSASYAEYFESGVFYNSSQEKISIGIYYVNPQQRTDYITDLDPGGSWQGEMSYRSIYQNSHKWLYKSPPSPYDADWLFTSPMKHITEDHTYTGEEPLTHATPVKPDPVAESKDPISTINGNVSVQETIITVPCAGVALGFDAHYNSGLDYDGELGHRWTHTYEWFLWATNNLVETDGTNSYMVLQTGVGQEFWFKENASSNYDNPYDNNWLLEKLTNNDYTVTLPLGIVYSFDSNGVLATVSDSWDNSLTLSYTNTYPTNRLITVEHSNGQKLEFSYTDTLISVVTTPTTNFTITLSYNSQSELTNIVRTTSLDSYVVTYSYDSCTNHSLTQRVNVVGDVFSYGYVTNSGGETTSTGMSMVLNGQYYEHTLSHSTNVDCETTLTYVRGAANQEYTYYYNSFLKRIDAIHGPNSSTLKTEYTIDAAGDTTWEKVENTSISEYIKTKRTYDSHHNVTEESFGYCATPADKWLYAYNTNHVPTSITDPESHKIELELTNASPAVVKTYYDGTNYYETTFSYATNGLLSCVTNANGHSVQYSYDSYGRLNEVDPQAGPTITYSNNVLGHLETITLPGPSGNRVTTFDPDELGRVQSITYPDSSSETFKYDALGNLTNHVDIGGRTAKYTYLPARRLASVTRSLDGTDVTTQFDYDQQFNTLTIKDALNRSVEGYVLDIQDRATTITNVEGQTMSVTYGVADYVNSVTRFDGTTVDNSYNSDGLLSEAEYPGSTTTFTYYDDTMLKTVGDGQGTIANFYNDCNWLTNTAGIVSSSTVSYTYFPAGNISNVSSVAGSLTYSYDEAERVTVSDGYDGKFTYSYNTNNGLASKMTCTNTGVFLDYAYNDMDRLTGVTWNDSSTNVLRSFSYSYNNAGMITNVTQESGQKQQFSYDDLDRLTGDKRLNSSGETLYDVSYGYDLVGNRTNKTCGDGSINYTLPYGASGNRMTAWASTTTGTDVAKIDVSGHSSEPIGTNPNLGQLYVSNLLARTPSVSTTNFTAYDVSLNSGTQQIVVAIGDAAGNVGYATNTVVVTLVTGASYSYSTAGCLTQAVYSGTYGYSATNILSWNSRYRLTTVATNGVSAESYEYDALGRCTRVVSGATTNYSVYDGIHVIAEVNSSGVRQKSYTHGPGIDNLLAYTDHTTTNAYYYLTDHLGSVHAVVDSSGTIVESYRYDAWGRVLGVYDANNQPLTESAIGNHYLWQGRWYSWKTGLYYFRARWYDPVVGRWLSKDPIGISGGLNQYVFADNNPVNYGDPFGLCSDDDDDVGLGFWDWVQGGLDVAGLTPGVGIFPDAANTLISAGRGNWGDFAFNAAAMVPVLGQVSTGAKYAKRGAKVGKALKRGRRIRNAAEAVQNYDNMYDAQRLARRMNKGERMHSIEKGRRKAKNALNRIDSYEDAIREGLD